MKRRKYPIGAEYSAESTQFRVWAPASKNVTLVYKDKAQETLSQTLQKESDGFFSIEMPDLKPGTHYLYKLDSFPHALPDPASRFQPMGIEGPSSIIDSHFPWTDSDWTGIEMHDQIFYEMHIGTFTQQGTFKAATEKLGYLAELGITVIEVMPINEFPGRFGWGYDGIYLYAPYHVYGTPYDVKNFINKAHKLGIGVILDVVYNHFGPEGNYFAQFSKNYFNLNKTTEWGDAINFDHPHSREYFVTNARYWIEEFHFDGLRIDATPWFFCNTPTHVLKEISQYVKKARTKNKKIIIGESETQEVKLLQSYLKGGYQFDGLWNDDFHHTASVRLKGKREAYYTDYLGSPQEFISALKYGFLYQGQYYAWQKKNRGSPNLAITKSAMIIFLENHDQIANTGEGKRIYQQCDFGNFKALTCLLLLGPNTPMIFQGQEFGSTSPFYYFADHKEVLNKKVQNGRKKFLAQFPSLSSKDAQSKLKNPADPLTFKKCKLNFKEQEKNTAQVALYKNLIHLKKNDKVFKSMADVSVDGAILNSDTFLLRFFGKHEDRIIIINFGPHFIYNPAPEPLIAPARGLEWEILWSSESFEYGGEGIAPTFNPFLIIPGHSATIFKPKSRSYYNEK